MQNSEIRLPTIVTRRVSESWIQRLGAFAPAPSRTGRISRELKLNLASSERSPHATLMIAAALYAGTGGQSSVQFVAIALIMCTRGRSNRGSGHLVMTVWGCGHEILTVLAREQIASLKWQSRGRSLFMASYQLSRTMDRSEWLTRYPRLTKQQVETVVHALRGTLGDEQVIANRDQLLAYSYDATGERHWPDVVVLPRDAQDVSQALTIAHRYHVPIIGRGASTNLSGGTTPLVGGLVVSFARMNRILEIDPARQLVRVQPGVVNADLAQALKPYGLFYPPDPSSHRISTLGGNLAENSGGPHCVKYGVTTHHTLWLQVALSDGRLVDLPQVGSGTGSVLDLASIVVGSEGTLALVTEAVLSISPLPETTRTLLASFVRMEDAVRTVFDLVAARVNPSALELMDGESIRVIEAFVHAGYPVGAGAVLLIELDGAAAQVDAAVPVVQDICARQNSLKLEVARTQADAEALWRGRRAHYGATARLAPHLWVQDVTVPRPHLVEMMERVLAIGRELDLTILTAAHAGDGNLHPAIPYDPRDLEQVGRLRRADRAILEACVALGGSITGEHGVGIDKAEHLPLMYSPGELQAMAEIKEAFDPQGVLNPLKALWPAAAGPEPAVAPSQYPLQVSSVPALQEAMRWSQQHGEPISIRGQGRRSRGLNSTRRMVDMRIFDGVFDLDRDNLSIEVGAGMRAGTLARILHQEGLDLPGIEPFMDETMGGLIAANAAYWRRSSGHGWRDVLLAAEFIDGRGRLLRFGTKTMKNVAGYDLAKLLVGSQGRLGAMTRLTLRLVPQPHLRAIAVSPPMDPNDAVNAAQRIMARADAPQGLLLVKRAQARSVEIWCAGDLLNGISREKLNRDVGLTLRYDTGDDAWLALEQRRLHQVYSAVGDGSYRSGRIPIAERDWTVIFRDEQAFVNLCPSGRWYEMMGSKGEDPWADAVNQDVARLCERIDRIFDAEQLLR